MTVLDPSLVIEIALLVGQVVVEFERLFVHECEHDTERYGRNNKVEAQRDNCDVVGELVEAYFGEHVVYFLAIDIDGEE